MIKGTLKKIIHLTEKLNEEEKLYLIYNLVVRLNSELFNENYIDLSCNDKSTLNKLFAIELELKEIMKGDNLL